MLKYSTWNFPWVRNTSSILTPTPTRVLLFKKSLFKLSCIYTTPQMPDFSPLHILPCSSQYSYTNTGPRPIYAPHNEFRCLLSCPRKIECTYNSVISRPFNFLQTKIGCSSLFLLPSISHPNYPPHAPVPRPPGLSMGPPSYSTQPRYQSDKHLFPPTSK